MEPDARTKAICNRRFLCKYGNFRELQEDYYAGNYGQLSWFAWVKLGIDIHINSSSRSAAYMHQGTESALVQEMACRLLGPKSLSEPMLTYCQLQPSVKFESKYERFHSQKCILICRLQNGGHIVEREGHNNKPVHWMRLPV